MHRIFVTSTNDIEQGYIDASHPHFRHLAQVVKLRVKDHLEICVPNSCVATVQLTEVSKKTLRFTESSPRVNVIPDRHTITICQSLPKGEKMSTLLKMCTELGVRYFQPIVSDNSVIVPKKMDGKVERWQFILETAAMQSKQTSVPVMHELDSLENCINKAKDDGCYLIALNEHEKNVTYKHVISSILKGDGATEPLHFYVFIGPEGGWSKRESELFDAKQVPSATIGSTLLRTEHAGFFAASCIKYETLDL